MTDIIFSFDTEDFTSDIAADAIYREAEMLRREGIRGGFCLVGLLAKQLESWKRDDILDALKFHDIGCHSYGHSIHPTINEYTDIDDFDAAYDEFIKQETEAIKLIKHATGGQRIYCGLPPGNQESYVAMYAYADMGLPIYPSAFFDTEDNRGMYFCNSYHIKYTFCLEQLHSVSSDEELQNIVEELATKKRAVLYTHPHRALFSQHWDRVNYYKENKCGFGNWQEAQRYPTEQTEKFFGNFYKLIKLLKEDKRFRITSYSELAQMLASEKQRKIVKSDIAALQKQINESFFPVTEPVSLCLSDMFLACRDFLLGKEEHICGKVYGFLEAPAAISDAVTLSAEDIRESAAKMNTERFLPHFVEVGGHIIGPGDWLRAAMAVINGNDTVRLEGAPQLPPLDFLPYFTDTSMMGWMQSDDFKDEYLTKRLKLQSWTIRFFGEVRN